MEKPWLQMKPNVTRKEYDELKEYFNRASDKTLSFGQRVIAQKKYDYLWERCCIRTYREGIYGKGNI